MTRIPLLAGSRLVVVTADDDAIVLQPPPPEMHPLHLTHVAYPTNLRSPLTMPLSSAEMRSSTADEVIE